MVIFASEDVGVADPSALQVALAAKDAVDFVGMPEGRIPLAHAALTLARAPKNNAAYVAIGEALAEVEKTGPLPVPHNLRNPVNAFMKGQGYGKDYRYAHSDPKGATAQPHLPVGVSKRVFVP
jgi:putative ATPase